MKIPAQIRRLLADGQARTAREIYTALGTHPIKTAESASNQVLRGLLVKDSSVYPARYSLGRALPEKLTKEEVARRSRERNAEARRRKGCRTIEQVKLEAAQKTAQHVLEAKLREAKRLAAPRKESTFVEQPKKPGRPQSIRIEPRKLGMTEAAPVKDTLPCTESWLAANPDKLVRLPPGVWANPVLRFEY